MLPGISTEQLRSRLNRMVADGMLTRKRYREVPPRVDYELTERAQALAPVLGELARWGYEWAWGAPRPSESVDIGAIFRLLPGLVISDSCAPGSVALTVLDGHAGEPARYLVTLSPAGAVVAEKQAPFVADAQLEGTTAGWVRALRPAGDTGGLSVSGREDLTGLLLGLLSLGRSADETPLTAAQSATS